MLLIIVLFGLLCVCAPVLAQDMKLIGNASWYGPGFHGRKAANGSIYNMYAMTAAHKTLKFGTKLKVIHKKTGKSVIVTITDRGPYVKGRILDLSKAAASKIGISGVGQVEAIVL